MKNGTEFSPPLVLDRKAKILIAEDDLHLCEIEKLVLDQQPDMMCCGVANDGKSAIELIKLTNPDVIILDQTMPFLDGLGTLVRLNKKRGKLPYIVITSANAGNIIMRESFENGADIYMEKPYDIYVIIEHIRRLLSRHYSAEKAKVISAEISSIIMDCGVSVKSIGYKYICAAIEHLSKSHEARPVMKVIYEDIAKAFSTDYRCVESAISCSVKEAEAYCSSAFARLKNSANLKAGKSISNSAFLLMITNELNLRI